MIPFDRPPMTFYWRSIVTKALAGVACEILNVEKNPRPWNSGQGSIKVIENATFR